MIVFKSIKYKNLLSTGNAFTEIKLNESRNALIVGENGSGKCLHPATKITVRTKSSDVEKKFHEFMKKR